MDQSNDNSADVKAFCSHLQQSAHTAHGADLEALCAQRADKNGEVTFDALMGIVRRLMQHSAREDVVRGTVTAAGSLRGSGCINYAAFLSFVRAGSLMPTSNPSNSSNKGNSSNSDNTCLSRTGLRVFEFFSGIGGFRVALPRNLPLHSICAFDTSPTPNAVYRHNFPNCNLRQGLVEHLSLSEADGAAELWTMSPPCQPFTTTANAHQRDDQDMRCMGLRHLGSLLLRMRRPPFWICMENVKGFVGSRSHKRWLRVLRRRGYSWRQFLLSPVDFGVPNHRLRYFLIAERSKRFTEHSGNKRNVVALDGRERTVAKVPTYIAARNTSTPDAMRFVPRARQLWLLFDLETTGFSWRRDDITQCCFRLLKWQESQGKYCNTGDDITSFVRTQRPIPIKVQEVTGITEADVHNAPTFGAVCERLRRAIAVALGEGDDPYDLFLVAHNGFRFDCPFLLKAIAQQYPDNVSCGMAPLLPPSRDCRTWAVDTLEMARFASFECDLPNKKLGTLFKIVTGEPLDGAHRADADVEAMERIFRDARMQEHRFQAEALRSEASFAELVREAVICGTTSASASSSTGLVLPCVDTRSGADSDAWGDSSDDDTSLDTGTVWRSVREESCAQSVPLRPLREYLLQSELSPTELERLQLTQQTLSKPWASGLSMVGPNDTTTFCFTAGYGKVMHKSSGSLLLPSARVKQQDAESKLQRDNMLAYLGDVRLFSPRELLLLFGFPPWFSFPPQHTMRQCWKCIGNSLNVTVLTAVLHELLCGGETVESRGAERLEFGKFAARTAADVLENERGYVRWALGVSEPNGALARFVQFVRASEEPWSAGVRAAVQQLRVEQELPPAAVGIDLPAHRHESGTRRRRARVQDRTKRASAGTDSRKRSFTTTTTDDSGIAIAALRFTIACTALVVASYCMHA